MNENLAQKVAELEARIIDIEGKLNGISNTVLDLYKMSLLQESVQGQPLLEVSAKLDALLGIIEASDDNSEQNSTALDDRSDGGSDSTDQTAL